jgi:hypothetical protein
VPDRNFRLTGITYSERSRRPETSLMIMSVAYMLDFLGVVYYITFNKRAVDLVIQCARACAVEVIA